MDRGSTIEASDFVERFPLYKTVVRGRWESMMTGKARTFVSVAT